MRLLKSISLHLFLIISFSTLAQNDGKINRFGLKAGVNSSKYTPNSDLVDYQSRTGFYAGIFYKVKLNQKFSFKPELVFSLQGSSITNKNIEIDNGNLLFSAEPYDFDFDIYDYVVALPLTIQYNIVGGLYFGAGPQFNFIVEQTFQTDEQLLDGTGLDRSYGDGESFEFGTNLVLGYDISKNFSLQAGAFSAIGNRNNDAKSFVLNFGLEYSL